MELELASKEHGTKIFELAMEFIKNDTLYGKVSIDEEKVKELVEAFYEPSTEKIGIVLVDENKVTRGFVGGLVEEMPFSRDRMAVELVWTMDKDYRGGKGAMKLLNAYEHWAREIAECQFICLSSVKNDVSDKVRSLYRKKGYEETETTFLKEIK